jgi:hypothetical protein
VWVRGWNLTDSHSTRIATLRRVLTVTHEQQFPQALAGNKFSVREGGESLPKTVSASRGVLFACPSV